MSMTQEQQIKYSRGDVSPADSSLVFFRYAAGKEVWVLKERLETVKAQSKVANAKQRKKPEHKERMKLYFREYNKRPYQKARMSEYYKKPEVRARIREQWATDPERRRKAKEYNESPAGRAVQKKARENRREAIRAWERKHWKIRMQNPVHRIAHNCRTRTRIAINGKGTTKARKTKDMLGCSFEFFRGWIEGKFELGMSWLNYGVFWEIDHIKPVASYDLTKESEQLACFHYTNCQPLWKNLNLEKSDKLPDGTRGREVRTQLN